MIGHLVARSRQRQRGEAVISRCAACGNRLKAHRKDAHCGHCAAMAFQASREMEQVPQARSPRLHVASCYLPPKGSIAWSLMGRVVEAL